MSLLAEKTWRLRKNIEQDQILLALSSKFNTEAVNGVESEYQFYDDFDADLWQSDYLFCGLNKGTFQLFQKNKQISEVRMLKQPRFYWDFPDGLVRDRLKKQLKYRALLPVTTLSICTTNFLLRNNDQKIVVKGRLTRLSPDEQYFSLQVLRGYEKSCRSAESILDSSFKEPIDDFNLRYLLLKNGAQDLQPRKSIKVSITPDMPVENSVRRMAVAMLEQAQLNVEGTVADIDTEFLHQYRVNLRKVRSLLGLLKKVIPLVMLEEVKPKLSFIAGKTNKLRDLDVFLLDHDHYRAMLPLEFSSGLNELYAVIEKQRKREKHSVAKYLLSEDYTANMAYCLSELAKDSTFEHPISRKPVLAVVNKLLLKRYQKMNLIVAAFHIETPDEDIHDLRIEFKKLRYLIEFFIDVLPKKRTHQLLSHIKKTQTVLGDFNDLCVQIEFLTAYRDDSKIEMTKALSAFIAILYLQQKQLRCMAEKTLLSFFTDDMATEFNLLYGALDKGVLK